MEQSENTESNESEGENVPQEYRHFLTPKQEMFCREYIVDFNGSQAAIRAGYSEKTAGVIACELLKKPNIKARVDALIEDRSDALAVTQDWVVRKLKVVAGRCLQEIRPLLDKKGDQVTDDEGRPLFVYDSRGANTALELLGKHLGAFKEGDKNTNVTVINMTPDFGDGKKIDENAPDGEAPKEEPNV